MSAATQATDMHNCICELHNTQYGGVQQPSYPLQQLTVTDHHLLDILCAGPPAPSEADISLTSVSHASLRPDTASAAITKFTTCLLLGIQQLNA